jgi:hypothetical protein
VAVAEVLGPGKVGTLLDGGETLTADVALREVPGRRGEVGVPVGVALQELGVDFLDGPSEDDLVAARGDFHLPLGNGHLTSLERIVVGDERGKGLELSAKLGVKWGSAAVPEGKARRR